jgi:predicted nucleic acid-binding Zn finger protein
MARMTKAAKLAEQAKRMARLTEAQAIVAKGTCPTCGTKLYRNLSLSGWYQCGHVGAVGFQKEPGPACDFQIFYDPTPEQHAAILAAKGADFDATLRRINTFAKEAK